MGNVRLVCANCGHGFLWTKEDKVAALNALKVDDLFDTQRLKMKTERMKRPTHCGGCRAKMVRSPAPNQR